VGICSAMVMSQGPGKEFGLHKARSSLKALLPFVQPSLHVTHRSDR
jgi:hypothetical protein